jgi:hypothetical protein
MMADRTQSPAYGVLRASSRRLLRFIEYEIARSGGDSVTLYADQLAVVGSIRVVLPGLSELSGLGLIDWQRLPKRHCDQPVGSLARYRDGETGNDRQRNRADATHAAVARAVRRKASASDPVVNHPDIGIGRLGSRLSPVHDMTAYPSTRNQS